MVPLAAPQNPLRATYSVADPLPPPTVTPMFPLPMTGPSGHVVEGVPLGAASHTQGKALGLPPAATPPARTRRMAQSSGAWYLYASDCGVRVGCVCGGWWATKRQTPKQKTGGQTQQAGCRHTVAREEPLRCGSYGLQRKCSRNSGEEQGRGECIVSTWVVACETIHQVPTSSFTRTYSASRTVHFVHHKPPPLQRQQSPKEGLQTNPQRQPRP